MGVEKVLVPDLGYFDLPMAAFGNAMVELRRASVREGRDRRHAVEGH